MFKKIRFFVFVMFVVSIAHGLFASDTFAHTASMTTTGSVEIDASAAGDGANLGFDTLTVDSTCPFGYTVSIAGPTDSTLYLNGDNTSTSTIPASTGTLANPVSILGNNIGTWGFTTDANATINSNFIGLTDTKTQLAAKASASEAGGDVIDVFYGVSVSPATAPGTYTLAESSQGAGDNAIVYYLTPSISCDNYIIRYNDNGANSATTMSITHAVTENSKVTLAASNYKRAGYGFAGWSTVPLNPNSVTFQSDLAAAKTAGKVFGPNEYITADAALLAQATIENNAQYITMYAIWVKPATGATLQNWNGCSSLSIGDVVALADSRDNQVYSVAKLADGVCWMIENLRLEAANSIDAGKAQGYGGAFTGLADPETDNFSNSTVANSKYSTSNVLGKNQGYRIPRYRNDNTASTVSDMTATNQNVYEYGNYYNWAAAKATTVELSASTSDDAKTSLCPAGWKLPYGRSSGNGNAPGGYYYLNYKINNDSIPSATVTSRSLRTFPNNFVFSGYATNGSAINSRGGFDYYWTTTLSDGVNAFVLSFSDSNGGAGDGVWNLSVGGSVRCFATESYRIEFDANGGSGTMYDQTIEKDDATRLSSNTFTAPAMGQSYQNASGTTITGQANKYWAFWGWNTQIDGTGDWYKDKESVTNLTAAGGTITLYAQWKQATMDDMLTATSGTKTITHSTMQDMSGAVCANSDITTKAALQAAGKTGATTLTDDRDGTVRSYDVSKLADGKCWMTTNLALGTTSSVVLTSDDTDLVEGSTFTLPAGDTTAYTSSTPAAKIRLTNADGTSANGVYYTWAAAVADTSSISTGAPTTSICPRNWDLPTNDQYVALSTASSYSNSKRPTDLPDRFLASGRFTDGGTFYSSITASGFYWTATSSYSNIAYGVDVTSNTMSSRNSGGTAYGGNKYYRKNIRCIVNMDGISN